MSLDFYVLASFYILLIMNVNIHLSHHLQLQIQKMVAFSKKENLLIQEIYGSFKPVFNITGKMSTFLLLVRY